MDYRTGITLQRSSDKHLINGFSFLLLFNSRDTYLIICSLLFTILYFLVNLSFLGSPDINAAQGTSTVNRIIPDLNAL